MNPLDLRARAVGLAREGAVLRKRRIAKTVDFDGIQLRIDRPQGFVQRGKDDKGNAWERTYKTDYGYVPRTSGGDGDELDVYVGPNSHAKLAYWIQQRKADGSFDEYKLMLGFGDRRAAKGMWSAHTPEKYYGGIATTSLGVVKALLGVDPARIIKSLDLDALVEAEVSGTKARAGRVEATIAKGADTAGLLLEAGPPNEWSGAIASMLGEDRRKKIEALWNALSDEDKARVAHAFESGFDAPRDGRATAEFMMLHAALAARYGDLAKGGASKSMEARLLKAAAPADPAEQGELQYILGVVLEPEVVDGQGDIYDADEVRKAAWLYMDRFRNVGLQHEILVNEFVSLVESYIAPTDLEVAGKAIKAGTWLAGFVVNDPDLWDAVKTGKITGLSIGGVAMKVDPTTGAVIPPPTASDAPA